MAEPEQMTTPVPVMEAIGVTAGYGKQPIIFEVSARFGRGSITSILGPNGAGKSTFLKSLFGLARTFSGTVLIEGQTVATVAMDLVERGVCYVPQLGNIFPSLSVRENLDIGTYVRKGRSMESVLEVFTDLKPVLKKRAGKLSGGQRNMLGVARALMSDPKVLLLDEATGGLAPLVARRLWEHVAALAKEGVAVVAVEQNVSLALEFSDSVYVLVSGRNSFSGTPAELNESADVEHLFLGASGL